MPWNLSIDEECLMNAMNAVNMCDMLRRQTHVIGGVSVTVAVNIDWMIILGVIMIA